jgi:hypothetical protein
MGAAAAASLAFHALGMWVWVILRARMTRERQPAPEEPMLVEVIAPEPATQSVAAPVPKSAPRIVHHEPAAPSPPVPSVSAPPIAPVPAVTPSQSRPARRPISLALAPHVDAPPAEAPAAKLHPAFDPRAFPADAPPPMETPGIDLESVLEFKRERERPMQLPEVFDKFLRDRKAFEKPRPDYTIKRQKDGSAVYHDQRADRFDATLAPDGSLEFDDHHVHRDSFTKQFKKWLEDPFHNAPPMPSLAFGIDITDELMRAHGEDPYADIKRKLLASTLEERQRMADVYRRETLAAALVGLRSYLRLLAADSHRSHAEKRRLLRELADETDDTPAGRRAREIILEFLDQFQRR